MLIALVIVQDVQAEIVKIVLVKTVHVLLVAAHNLFY